MASIKKSLASAKTWSLPHFLFCLLNISTEAIKKVLFPEEATGGVLYKKVLQNSQEKIFARVSFFFLKRRLWHRYFPVNFSNFLRTPFYRTPLGDWLYISLSSILTWEFEVTSTTLGCAFGDASIFVSCVVFKGRFHANYIIKKYMIASSQITNTEIFRIHSCSIF